VWPAPRRAEISHGLASLASASPPAGPDNREELELPRMSWLPSPTASRLRRAQAISNMLLRAPAARSGRDAEHQPMSTARRTHTTHESATPCPWAVPGHVMHATETDRPEGGRYDRGSEPALQRPRPGVDSGRSPAAVPGVPPHPPATSATVCENSIVPGEVPGRVLGSRLKAGRPARRRWGAVRAGRDLVGRSTPSTRTITPPVTPSSPACVSVPLLVTAPCLFRP